MSEYVEKIKNALEGGVVEEDGYGTTYVDYTGQNWFLGFSVNDAGEVFFDLDFTADGKVNQEDLSRFAALIGAFDAFNSAE